MKTLPLLFALTFLSTAVHAIEINPVDGDTFWYNGIKIWVMSIDTPEPSKYGNAECPAEARLGDKASKFTEDIIMTRSIKIEYSGREDRYGRALARVRVGDSRGVPVQRA